MKRAILGGALFLPFYLAGEPTAVDFEDLPLVGEAVQAYAGPGGGIFYNGSDLTGGFEVGGAFFENAFTDWGGGFTSWAGWSYSTTTDTETPGFVNEFSAFPGGAAGGSVYAVGYLDAFSGYDPLEIALPAGRKAPLSVAVTNTTYAALAIRDGISGDFPVEAFGTGDTFKLIVKGKDWMGQDTGTVEFYLADYRVEVETPYVVDSWIDVDISPLGTEVAAISLSLESTDVGEFGMNTPAYVALDNLVLEETPTWAGYDQLPDGWVDTGNFLGWIYPQGDYVYLLSLARYGYLPEAEAAKASGSWIYLPR